MQSSSKTQTCVKAGSAGTVVFCGPRQHPFQLFRGQQSRPLTDFHVLNCNRQEHTESTLPWIFIPSQNSLGLDVRRLEVEAPRGPLPPGLSCHAFRLAWTGFGVKHLWRTQAHRHTRTTAREHGSCYFLASAIRRGSRLIGK